MDKSEKRKALFFAFTTIITKKISFKYHLTNYNFDFKNIHYKFNISYT